MTWYTLFASTDCIRLSIQVSSGYHYFPHHYHGWQTVVVSKWLGTRMYMYCVQVKVMADRNIHCLSPPPLMDPNDTCTIPGRGCIRLYIGAPFKIQTMCLLCCYMRMLAWYTGRRCCIILQKYDAKNCLLGNALTILVFRHHLAITTFHITIYISWMTDSCGVYESTNLIAKHLKLKALPIIPDTQCKVIIGWTPFVYRKVAIPLQPAGCVKSQVVDN